MLLQFASWAYRKTESKGSTARGLGQAAVGDQEQRTGRHDSGQAWFSSSRPPCTRCHNIHGRRSTGTGTRWSLGSAEAAGSSHSHSTGLLGGGGRGAEPRREQLAPSGAGATRPLRPRSARAVPGPAAASFPAACPTRPSAAARSILPSPHPTCPKALPRAPSLPRRGAAWQPCGFSRLLPRCAKAQTSRGSTILAGPFQLGRFSESMTASSPDCPALPLSTPRGCGYKQRCAHRWNGMDRQGSK